MSATWNASVTMARKTVRFYWEHPDQRTQAPPEQSTAQNGAAGHGLSVARDAVHLCGRSEQPLAVDWIVGAVSVRIVGST
jgi:hypothetical protein